MIRLATADDAAAVAAIYNPYILDTVISFEEEPVSVDDMASRMAAVLDSGLPWLVHETDDGVTGYAYASPWHKRAAYRQTVETSIYLAQGHTGQGLGRWLMEHLLGIVRELGMHSAIAGVTLPNPASVALHERLGYTKAAHYHEIGYKFGQWLDVGYWELLLDGQPSINSAS